MHCRHTQTASAHSDPLGVSLVDGDSVRCTEEGIEEGNSQSSGKPGERKCCSRAWIGKGPKTYTATLQRSRACYDLQLASQSDERLAVQPSESSLASARTR
jgi:hypothetical protein